MVNPDNIIELRHRLYAPCPPGIAVFFHHIPAEQRVAPELAVIGKCVRRAAGHIDRIQILIQIKLSWVCPDIRAVPRNIYRHIPDNLNSLRVDIRLQLSPLFKEQILEHLVKPDILRIGPARLRERPLLARL